MSARAAYSTPIPHAMDIERSLGWARAHCEGGVLTLLRTEHAVDPTVQGVMLYMYSPDLRALHAQLQTSGVAVPPISYPGYMPSGEIQLRGPGGYSVIVAHWGPNDQEARE